jgi:NADP-dependent 3-hydroxy acid dehydrogenase YdfG
LNKTALVTGASSGIGESICYALLDMGYTVYAGARRVERMQALADRGAHVIALDVTDDASMVAAVNSILEREKRIDVLVNNAGYGSYGALEDVPLDEGRRQFEVNVFGLARMTQLVIPAMRAQHSGTIFNVSSIGGKMHEPLGSWYHGTKFAIEGMSDCLRMELEPFGIDVVVIEPGGIKTEWSGIARENLLRYSGATAYAEQVRESFMMADDYESTGSDPAIIGAIVTEALRAKRPRTRYMRGMGAFMVPILAVLPDRAKDRFLRLMQRAAHRYGAGPAKA